MGNAVYFIFLNTHIYVRILQWLIKILQKQKVAATEPDCSQANLQGF